MEKKRKIAMVVRKVSFAEAEELDDIYWAEKTEEERLKVLIDLRKIFWGSNIKKPKIQKVVFKYNLYEEAG
jgi:hypothetical protein